MCQDDFTRNCLELVRCHYLRTDKVSGGYVSLYNADGIMWEVRHTGKSRLPIDDISRILAIRPCPPTKFYNLF